MNRWDALLAWLCHRKNTSFQRVKTACRTLSLAEGFGEDWLPLGHATYWTRPLFELGCIEYDTGNRIIACPPGLLELSQANRAVLAGMWTRQRLAKIKKCDVRLLCKRPSHGPTRFAVVGETKAIHQAAKECEVWIAPDPGDQILSRLPSVDRWVETFAEDNSPPSGVWEKMSFRDHRPIWVASREPFTMLGFYRRRSGQKIYVHVTAGGRRRAANPDQRYVAMWYESPPFPWVYDSVNRRLYLSVGTPRLPLLIARSLVAASGCVATRVKHRDQLCWCYNDISKKRASRAASLLGQELLIERVGS